MPIQESEIKKVLVIDLGQVGDVIMSFPSLAALRDRFPFAELVAVAGKTPGALINDLGLADRVLTIDRYALLRGPKLGSIAKIFGIVSTVRKENFDLVVDLHSLYESNLLGYFSGARYRLFANRRNRSLDFLSNVRPRPPQYDPSKHLANIYLDVLSSLGVNDADLNVQIVPPADLIANFRSKYSKQLAESGRRSIALLTGAGNPSRKWPLKNFVELAFRFRDKGDEVFVFLGPEEKPDESSISEQFGRSATVVPDLTLIELAAALSTMDMAVGNDTGTTHLAAVSGPRVVMITDNRAPETFRPIGSNALAVKTDVIEKITVDDVWAAQIFIS